MAAIVAKCGGGSKKRKCEGLGEMHDDVLERVLARLPPASYFRLRGVCRRWSDAASSPTFLAACGRVNSRDPWFLMLSEGQEQEQERCRRRPAVAFDAGEGAWARCGGVPGHVMPVAASGGRVLYRAADTGALTVANPLTGVSRVLPAPPAAPGALHAVAMYGSSPYRVVLITGELPDLSMTVFDSSKNAWEDAVALSRKPEASSPEREAEAGVGGGDETVYFLSKSGDVMATNMQRSASRQYSSVVTCGDGGDAVAYFLSHSGAVVACDLSRRVFTELPRILPVYFEYSIDVVACGGRAYVVVLSELLGTASLRLWEFAGGAWRQVAAMPPSMSHAFHGKKADVNCVGHGDRVMVCEAIGRLLVRAKNGVQGVIVKALSKWKQEEHIHYHQFTTNLE
uniref:F-box domain-containing protein n=1 Tax=Oryza punctata TaxID=4537 RepID=A0A0E0LND9_ORYPU